MCHCITVCLSKEWLNNHLRRKHEVNTFQTSAYLDGVTTGQYYAIFQPGSRVFPVWYCPTYWLRRELCFLAAHRRARLLPEWVANQRCASVTDDWFRPVRTALGCVWRQHRVLLGKMDMENMRPEQNKATNIIYLKASTEEREGRTRSRREREGRVGRGRVGWRGRDEGLEGGEGKGRDGW